MRFFKMGKGAYGEGDVFLGIKMPQARALAQRYADKLPFSDITELLQSPYHEERLIALLLLVHLFKTGNLVQQKKIFTFYLTHTASINNWDLVDLSAHKIVGRYLEKNPRKILYTLARSHNLWERRIAIIATAHFISQNDFAETLAIAHLLLTDTHDLIHKAVGWMLREVGKKSIHTEETFLKKYYMQMPRTMLRYAIEKFPEEKRQRYLKGTV